nr:MBL fold metallo-hydrolase [Candidatus Njordarchaeum guaymaensis]
MVVREHRPNAGAGDRLKFEILWYDSLGAKSSSVLVWTPDVAILIDPGASGMQPGFPMSKLKKAFYRLLALRKISGAARNAQAIVISHYHYDHFCHLGIKSIDSAGLYRGKQVFVKDPNQFINRSQWARAREFFGQLVKKFGQGTKLSDMLEPPVNSDFADPEESMPLAMGRAYGDYQRRRNQIIRKGRRWFRDLCKQWSSEQWIPEVKLGETEFKFMDGRRVELGNTVLRFSKPVFHGVEYDRLGWVSSTVVEYGGRKLIHTSDVQGAVFEDYADWIVKENPTVLFMDGPPTYLFGFVVNRLNFNRTTENACRIIRECDKAELIIYDHHLMRDPLFRKRVAEVYKVAEASHRKVISAAEYLGKEIIALKVGKKKPLSAQS